MSTQSGQPFPIQAWSPSVEAHFLGQLDFEQCLALQQRVAAQIGERDDGQICLLLCEHPNVLTVGRGGSAADIRFESGMVQSGRMPVRWVKRGGGCLVHAPGQLAVYPIVPLHWHGWTVGNYLDRLLAGIVATLEKLGIARPLDQNRRGLWGRTGQLAAMGVAVGHGVTYHGAYINVAPSMGLFRLVRADADEPGPPSSLLAEHHRPVRMTSVRAELVGRLAEAFDCERYHLHTGHPLLRRRTSRVVAKL